MVEQVDTRVGPVPVRSVGEGPAVLAVHGLLVDGRLWDDTARLLAPHARVVLPDLPLGCQRRAVPDRARLTPASVAAALVDVLDGLGIDRAVLVGNDTGGALAQIAAAAHPDRVAGIVLAGCDAFAHFPPPLLRPLLALARVPAGAHLVVRALGTPALLADPGPLNLFTRRGFGRALVADLLAPARTDRAVRDDLRAFVATIAPDVLLAAVDGLRAHRGRAAVVWGRQDRFFAAGDAVALAALLDTTVTWCDDAATFVPLDRPDAVADAVRSVLAVSEGVA
jgi:pimeloyl-ACP methyl ester carboxylesterase